MTNPIKEGLPALRSACARGTAIPDVVGVSPFMQSAGPFDITLASHDGVWGRFGTENSIIGETPLPTGILLKAVHNGKPYTNDPDGVHCMIAAHGAENLPNPASFAAEDVTRIVGIVRNFVHAPSHASGYERLAGYQITDQRGMSQRKEKGLLSQTWANWHLHLIETSRPEIQARLAAMPPSDEKRDFETLARDKSSELFAVTSGLLLRPVVGRALAESVDSCKLQYVAGNPLLAPGSVNIDVSGLSDAELAHMMQTFQVEYQLHHRKVAEIFVANYDDFGSPRQLLPFKEREANVIKYLQQETAEGKYNPGEQQMLAAQLLYLARNAQPESVYLTEAKRRFAHIEDGKERGQKEQAFINKRVFWRVPAYTVGLQSFGNREVMTMREITATKGGAYEGYGISPMPQMNAPMAQVDYERIHKNAEKAFQEAVSPTRVHGNIFAYA